MRIWISANGNKIYLPNVGIVTISGAIKTLDGSAESAMGYLSKYQRIPNLKEYEMAEVGPDTVVWNLVDAIRERDAAEGKIETSYSALIEYIHPLHPAKKVPAQ